MLEGVSGGDDSPARGSDLLDAVAALPPTCSARPIDVPYTIIRIPPTGVALILSQSSRRSIKPTYDDANEVPSRGPSKYTTS